MSRFFEILETQEGQIYVLTKRRWMGFFRMPHTSVMPARASQLGRLGICIKWTTDDRVVLGRLHDATVDLAEKLGIRGLVEIANIAKVSEQAWKASGGAGCGFREMVRNAAQHGVPFPMSDDVLQYVKGLR